MTVLTPTRVSTSQFTWMPETNSFVAEASDLGKSFRFGRVWDDSCDEGLTLTSSKYPGQELVFYVNHTEVHDGDVLYWELKAVNPRVSFKVKVFND